MIGMLKRIFTENAHWKLISLVCAVILWWFVHSIVEEQKEMLEEPREVAVALINQPEGLIRTRDMINHFEVRISGPRELIKEISDDNLRYVIDLSSAQREWNNFPIFLSRVEGVPEGVRIRDATLTQISVYFDERVKRDNVPVSIETRGKPAPAYEVKEMSAEPALVTIDGARFQVERVNSVPTEPVDISGATGPVEKIVGFNLLGTYLEVVNQTDVKVTVRIAQQRGTKEFPAVPVRALNTLLSVTIEPAVVSLTVTGPVLTLKELPPATLNVYVDAQGLETGTHELPLIAEPPEGITVDTPNLGTAKVVLKPPRPATPAPQPVPTPPGG